MAVIGAGPAGLSAAYMLSKRGVPVEVFEAGTQPGGLAKSISLWNQTVDLGPHRFFSKDERVNRLWFEVVGSDFTVINRMTRIHYENKLFDYPLKPFDALAKLGLVEAVHCGLSYLKSKCSAPCDPATFEDWVVQHFGNRLYEMFFRTYSEKLWGISCQELDADFAAQRIRQLSLYEAVKNGLLKSNTRQHKTLVDEFAYPKLGAGMVYERMAQRIVQNGGFVHYGTQVEKVFTENGVATGIVLRDGALRKYDHIISSMPLPVLVARLPESPPHVKYLTQFLRFRNTILVYLQVDSPNLFPDNWLYVHSPEVRVGRITNFRNWSSDLYGAERSSILALEYWCNDEDALWREGEPQIVELAGKELRSSGLVGNAKILNGHVHRIPRCYPVYSTGYRKVLGPIQDYLGSIRGLQAIGRYGAFKYNNQDHSILMGILAAENVQEQASHNLWEVNTDYDSYQEDEAVVLR